MEYTSDGPCVFISYSHYDEIWKNRVVDHLRVLVNQRLLDLWDDRQIAAGDDWLPKIKEAINSCRVALLLISAKFLNSQFILNEEVPDLLKRREEEGVRVIPVMLEACAWERVDWLKTLQFRPKDGMPLGGMTKHKKNIALKALTEEIADLLASIAPTIKLDRPYVVPPGKIDPTAPDLIPDNRTPPVGPSEAQDVPDTSKAREGDPQKDAVKEIPKANLQAAGRTGLVNDLTGLRENTEAAQVDLGSRKKILKRPRHSGRVTALVVLPGGRRALSGSSDQTLRLWDLESGEEIRKFEGHSGGITAVAALPDGRRALSGSSDHTLRLWDLERREEIRKFSGHSSGITALAVLPDGRRALSGSSDQTLRLWDLESGEEIQTFPWTDVYDTYTETSYPRSHFLRLLRPDQEWLARIPLEKSGMMLKPTTVTRTPIIKHGHKVTTVAVLPSGSQALLGSLRGRLWLWDLERKEDIRTFAKDGERINAVAVLPNGTQALSGSSDGSLRLWNLASGQEIRKFPGHSGGITALAIMSDGHQALSVSLDQTLRLWDLDSGKCLARFDMDTAITCCAVVPNERWIIVGDDQGSIHVLKSIQQESDQ